MPIPSKSGVEPPKRTLLRDTVFEKLRDSILDGTLQPGERLHDAEIEQWLGVSRTPVREALNELVRIGLIESSPNRYTRVATPRDEDAIDALQTLGVLLGGVIRLAVPRMSQARRTKLFAQFVDIAALLRKDDAISVNNKAVSLWREITNECGNAVLINLCEQTVDGLAFKLRIARLSEYMDFSVQADLFEKLGELIREGDAIAAELAVEELHFLSGQVAAIKK